MLGVCEREVLFGNDEEAVKDGERVMSESVARGTSQVKEHGCRVRGGEGGGST